MLNIFRFYFSSAQYMIQNLVMKTEDKINIIQVVLFSVIYLQMTKTQL